MRHTADTPKGFDNKAQGQRLSRATLGYGGGGSTKTTDFTKPHAD